MRSRAEHSAPERGERIPWRRIAADEGIPFDQNLSERALYELWGVSSWPRHMLGPVEGSLTGDECDELVRLLSSCAPQQLFVSFFSLARRNWDSSSDLTFRGELNELMELLDGDEFTHSPEYWWPADRSWIVCTDYDSVFTIVGGSEALIDALVASDVLESVRADLELQVG